MRRGSIGERPEPTQQLALLGAEAGDIDAVSRSRQHRQKTEQQHLVKRVDHLATLSRVRKGSKMIKKKQSPRPEPLPCPSCRPFAASEAADRFRTLPRCHALFHPIALDGDWFDLPAYLCTKPLRRACDPDRLSRLPGS